MKTRTAEFLLALALTLRGTSLLFAKIAVRTMGPLLLLGTRFIIAFVLIALLFRKKLCHLSRTVLWHSALLGFIFVASMGFELYGLRTTPSSTTGFLENSIVVMVPLFTCLLHRRLPDKGVVLSVIVAMLGVILMTIKGVEIHFTAGELHVMAGAGFYAVAVILTDYICKKDDPAIIAVFQLFWIGFFAMIGSFLLEEPRLPASLIEWGAILWLAVVCSGVGFTLQPFAQKYTTAERSGLFVAFNPISAGILGIIFLHERMTLTGVLGSILVLVAVVIPTLLDRLDKNRRIRL